jgi:Putative Flp pilus-assembly TadE/G-like
MARPNGGRGSVSLLVVIMLPALLFAAGLVLDGGRQLQARRDANGAATAAARAAVQLSDRELFVRRLDPSLAADRAAEELGRQDAIGSVAVSGQSVTVTVRAAVDFLILPGGVEVSEESTATPEHGVHTGSTP